MVSDSSLNETVSIYQKKLKKGFNYTPFIKGFSYIFPNETGMVLAFVQTGKVRLLIEKYKEYYFEERQMFLIKNSGYQFDALQNSKLLLVTLDDSWFKFYEDLLPNNSDGKQKYVFTVSCLDTQSKLEVFVDSVLQCLIHKKGCSKNYQSVKQRELQTLLLKCYNKPVLVKFLARLGKDVLDFQQFILENYQKQRGEAELISISKLSPSTFKRRFKDLFGESPYQWMLSKRSEIIRKQLTETDLPIVGIMNNFDFTDASHFNRFCKSMFGYAPTVLRRNYKMG